METSQKGDKNEIVSEGTACQSAVKTKSTSGSDTVNAATGRHISTGITNDGILNDWFLLRSTKTQYNSHKEIASMTAQTGSKTA